MKSKKIIICIALSLISMIQTGCKDKLPVPVEATDVNSVTFDDSDISFASVDDADDDSIKGEISLAEIQGNKMLKFTNPENSEKKEAVQKIKISAVKLLDAENLEKVKSIEFDLYADVTDDFIITENGDKVKAAGWIGGGGGTVDQNEDWYNFAEFSGGEYNLEFSQAHHIIFKFLLADTGKKWSKDMEDANFLIMRWGLESNSSTYIDNITFYDSDGKSIPLKQKESEEEPEK
ncbi:MAG: hypothetical protein K2G63_03020 [Oscillospiraceae bacterium]|nr:hypothetical protein [Oscillospiraceae bacterium]